MPLGARRLALPGPTLPWRRHDDRRAAHGTAASGCRPEHGTIDTVMTVVQYLVIAAVIGAVVFAVAALVFGRGEQMAPLPARVSPLELPATDLRGDHVRDMRFGLALRGYRMSDVDWALERLADEIDELRGRLATTVASPSSQNSDSAGPASAPASEPASIGPEDAAGPGAVDTTPRW